MFVFCYNNIIILKEEKELLALVSTYAKDFIYNILNPRIEKNKEGVDVLITNDLSPEELIKYPYKGYKSFIEDYDIDMFFYSAFKYYTNINIYDYLKERMNTNYSISTFVFFLQMYFYKKIDNPEYFGKYNGFSIHRKSHDSENVGHSYIQRSYGSFFCDISIDQFKKLFHVPNLSEDYINTLFVNYKKENIKHIENNKEDHDFVLNSKKFFYFDRNRFKNDNLNTEIKKYDYFSILSLEDNFNKYIKNVKSISEVENIENLIDYTRNNLTPFSFDDLFIKYTKKDQSKMEYFLLEKFFFNSSGRFYNDRLRKIFSFYKHNDNIQLLYSGLYHKEEDFKLFLSNLNLPHISYKKDKEYIYNKLKDFYPRSYFKQDCLIVDLKPLNKKLPLLRFKKHKNKINYILKNKHKLKDIDFLTLIENTNPYLVNRKNILIIPYHLSSCFSVLSGLKKSSLILEDVFSLVNDFNVKNKTSDQLNIENELCFNHLFYYYIKEHPALELLELNYLDTNNKIYESLKNHYGRIDMKSATDILSNTGAFNECDIKKTKLFLRREQF